VGESDKSSITAEKEIEDLDAAIDYIQSRGVEQVGLYGHSLGGYISLKNYRPEVEAMVSTAPVTDSIDTTKNNFIWTFLVKPISRIPSINYLIKKGKLMWIDSKIVEELKAIDQDKLLSKVECPVLIIHGSEDEVVSLEGVDVEELLRRRQAAISDFRNKGSIQTADSDLRQGQSKISDW
jgi:putative redox protein